LEPESIAVGQNQASVAVIGCNFGSGAKLRFNGVEREAHLAGREFISVPMLASDFAGTSTIGVTVEADVAPEDAKEGGQGAVLRSSSPRTLRIIAPGEVKVSWHAFGETRHIDVELRLILLILMAGCFAACVFGLNSFVNYAGEEKLSANWFWLYFARPAIGGGVALVFYLIIRGGLLAGTNADMTAVNPFGFVAVAALVGMFSDAALMKLNNVFDTLFQARDTRKQAIDDPVIEAPDVLPAAKVNTPYRYEFRARNGGGPLTWIRSGGLPTGLELTPAGVLEGTPTTQGSSTFSVQVKDAKDRVARKDCELVVS
jgi:hypothetical protein